MMAKFTPIRTGDDALDRVQDAIAKAINSTPATLACSARYLMATPQSFLGAVVTVVNFDAMDFDSDGAVTTGPGWRFTVPRTKGGLYLLTATVSLLLPGSTDCDSFMAVRKNGAEIARIARTRYTTNASGENRYVNGSTQVRCVGGDTIALAFYQYSGATRVAETGGLMNHIEISRIGS